MGWELLGKGLRAIGRSARAGTGAWALGSWEACCSGWGLGAFSFVSLSRKPYVRTLLGKQEVQLAKFSTGSSAGLVPTHPAQPYPSTLPVSCPWLSSLLAPEPLFSLSVTPNKPPQRSCPCLSQRVCHTHLLTSVLSSLYPIPPAGTMPHNQPTFPPPTQGPPLGS